MLNNNKKVRIKKLIELDNKIRDLDDDHETSERVSRLVYEDDRKMLVGEVAAIEKRRNRASLLFVAALILIFGSIFFFGIRSAKAESCEWIRDYVTGTEKCLTPALDQTVKGNPKIAEAVFTVRSLFVEAGFSTYSINAMLTGYISDVCPPKLLGLRDHNWDAMVLCSNNYHWWWWFGSPARVVAHEALHHFYKGESRVTKHVNLLFKDAKLYKETYDD